MDLPHHTDDGVNCWFYSRDIGTIPCCIDLFEYTGANVDPSLAFLAIFHRGHKSPFNHSLLGQGVTIAEAVAEAEQKSSGLTGEEIQATPDWSWRFCGKRPALILN